MNSARRAIVAGGAGFIGVHLCERLLADGVQVLCVDDFCTGSRDAVAALRERGDFELLEHDVREPFDAPPCDVIFNLACPASPRAYQRDPIRTLETSVLGTRTLLALARRHGAAFVQASTSEVYGDPQVHPQPERYWGHVNPVGTRACYDEGKRCAETLCMDHRRRHGMAVKIARIFNTYGSGMAPDDGRVVSNFIVQALAGEPLTVYGDGRQTRSLCHVDDTVDALVRLAATPAAFTGPVNVGNPHELTVLEIAHLVLELTGSASRVVTRPLPPDDPAQRRPDIALAREALGWQPRVALRDGLQRTIAHFASSRRTAAAPRLQA